MNRAIKVRIYPNKEQTKLIEKTFAAVRFRWNYALEERNNFYETNIKEKNLTKDEKDTLYKSFKPKTEAALKKEDDKTWLGDVSASAIVKTGRDLDEAFRRFFKGVAKGKPRFKSRYKNNSYSDYMSVYVDFGVKKLKLPKVGWVRFRVQKLPKWYTDSAVLRSITVSKDLDGNYYASMLFEYESEVSPKVYDNDISKCIGLDMSPDFCYLDSNGNPAPGFRKVKQEKDIARKLAHLQRSLARKKKGSRNSEKARLKLAKYEKHIANIRKDWREKETLRLVKSYNVIGIETLDIQGLEGNSYNAKNYVDIAWYDFTQKLLDKAQSYNCIVKKADKYFASSQICHNCGYKNPEVKDTSVRHWICPECGMEHDRDINAAINLRDWAIKELSHNDK